MVKKQNFNCFKNIITNSVFVNNILLQAPKLKTQHILTFESLTRPMKFYCVAYKDYKTGVNKAFK